MQCFDNKKTTEYHQTHPLTETAHTQQDSVWYELAGRVRLSVYLFVHSSLNSLFSSLTFLFIANFITNAWSKMSFLKFTRHWITVTTRRHGNDIMLLVTGLAWMHTKAALWDLAVCTTYVTHECSSLHLTLWSCSTEQSINNQTPMI